MSPQPEVTENDFHMRHFMQDFMEVNNQLPQKTKKTVLLISQTKSSNPINSETI